MDFSKSREVAEVVTGEITLHRVFPNCFADFCLLQSSDSGDEEGSSGTPTHVFIKISKSGANFCGKVMLSGKKDSHHLSLSAQVWLARRHFAIIRCSSYVIEIFQSPIVVEWKW